MRYFKVTTKTPVVIEIEKHLEDRLGRNPIDLVTAKIGHAVGASAYFKRTKINDYYHSIDYASCSAKCKLILIFNNRLVSLH
jgi:hypothetical protein